MNMLTRTLVKTEHGSVVFVHHRLSDIETVVRRYYEDHGHDVEHFEIVQKNYQGITPTGRLRENNTETQEIRR